MSEINYGCKFGDSALAEVCQVQFTGKLHDCIESNSIGGPNAVHAFSSEGKSLSKEDEKSYWGRISYENPEKAQGNEKDELGKETTPSSPRAPHQSRLQVKGSVIFGYGLEPLPVARFIMSESTEFDEDEDEMDEDDEVDLGDIFDWSNAFQ